MAQFPIKTRPWARILSSLFPGDTTVTSPGDIITSEDGTLRVGNGTTQNQHLLAAAGQHVFARALAYRHTSTAITPSATINTDGSAVVLSPNTDYAGIVPLWIVYTPSGVSSETLTVKATYTYSDASTATNTQTFTTNTATSLSNGVMATIPRDGLYITQVSIVAQSSKSGSTASVTVGITGLSV